MQINNAQWSSRALVAGALGVAALAACSSSSSSGGSTDPNDKPAAHAETFHNVTPAQNNRVQRVLPLMRGVAANTYQNGDLIVTFKPTATKLDQNTVENIVRSSKNAPATPSPSPSKSKRK
jgi:uncharacterized lipoprotein